MAEGTQETPWEQQQIGLVDRLKLWMIMRSAGAWESTWSLPTRQDYWRYVMTDTEGPVRTEPTHGEEFQALIATMEAQRQTGRDLVEEAHVWERARFQDVQDQIADLAIENDTHRAWLDSPASQDHIDYTARGEIWDLVEGLYTTEEMRLAHPDYYHRYLSPEADARERRIAEAIDRVSDPEYLGWQAEQRFYAAQDPHSEWYRADLYHGQPGPDITQEWDRLEQEFDENQLRIAAGEPSEAELARMQESPEARQARYYDDWEMSDAGIAAQDREIERFAAREPTIAWEDALPFRPDEGFVVDASQPGSDDDFQALLARLDQRLEALVQMTEHHAQDLTQKQGVRY